MLRFRAHSLVALCLLIASCASPPDPVVTSQKHTFVFDGAPEMMTLGPGDVVAVRVLGHPELSTSQDGSAVDRAGHLHLPLIGEQSVAGLGLQAAGERIEQALAQFVRQVDVTVELRANRSNVFYVLGHVTRPGAKPLDRAMTALEAAAEGGPFLRGADRSHVFVLRPHEDGLESHEFNLMAPGPAALVRIQKGDVVFVRQTGVDNFQEDWLPILYGVGNTLINGDRSGGLY